MKKRCSWQRFFCLPETWPLDFFHPSIHDYSFFAPPFAKAVYLVPVLPSIREVLALPPLQDLVRPHSPRVSAESPDRIEPTLLMLPARRAH